MRFPPEFDLHALETFVLAVELGGMSQCAAHLQVTQSAVSQTIAKLEAGIGTQLFDRGLRPLALTTSGRALYERSEQLLAQAKLTYDAVREQAARLPLAEGAALLRRLCDALEAEDAALPGADARRAARGKSLTAKYGGTLAVLAFVLIDADPV
jgi:DNA-binding MarR family transcriptional regulator